MINVTNLNILSARSAEKGSSEVRNASIQLHISLNNKFTSFME